MTSRLGTGAAYAMLCVIWGSTWLAIRIGLEGAPAFFGASLRFALASAVLFALVAAFRFPLPRGRAEWGLVAFVGLVLFTANYGLIYWGEANGVESGLGAILFATMPLQTAVVAHGLLARERLTVQKLLGIGLGFGGILLIFRGELTAAGVAKFAPMLAIVLSASGAAIVNVVIKRWGHDTDPVGFNALAMAIGTLALAGVSWSAGESWGIPEWPKGILAIVYLALAGSVVTFVTYLWLLKRIEATSMSFIAMITPIFALFLGITLAQEALDPLALGGAGLTFTGIYVSISKRAAAIARGWIGVAAVGDEVAASGRRERK